MASRGEAAGISPAILDALLDALAARVAVHLAAQGAHTPRYADAANNPLGSARSFLDAARRGDFESFKRGRHVVARWADVEAAMERRKRSVRATPGVDEDRAELIAAGVPLRPSRGLGR